MNTFVEREKLSLLFIRPSTFVRMKETNSHLLSLLSLCAVARPNCSRLSCKKCHKLADTSAADKVNVANAGKKAASAALKNGTVVDVESLL